MIYGVIKTIVGALAHPLARTTAGVVLIGMAVLEPSGSAAFKAAAGVLLCENHQ